VAYYDSGNVENPYAAPQVESAMLAEDDRLRGPEGIGGWLILPLLHLVLTILSVLVVLATQSIPAFTEGHFATLTDPNFVNYHPLWKPLLILEPIGIATVGVAAVWGLVLMFRKAKAFPRWMIIFYSVNLVYSILDVVLGMQIPLVASQNGAGLVQQAIRACIGAAIWIPYMRVSKRVKNTFVN
jgi:hypothetical protein